MRFTEQEMVFFSSITKGKNILGIPLHFHKGENGEAIEQTIRGLIKKGVLKSETELSENGFLPAHALESYKNASDHLILNFLHIAILEDDDAIVIIPLKNREYEMFRIPRVALMYKLLEQYPVLRGAGEGISEGEEQKDVDTFLKELTGYEGSIMAGKYRNGAVEREQVYFWQGENLYRYMFGSRIKSRMDAVAVRRELIALLQIRMEEIKDVRTDTDRRQSP